MFKRICESWLPEGASCAPARVKKTKQQTEAKRAAPGKAAPAADGPPKESLQPATPAAAASLRQRVVPPACNPGVTSI